MLVISRKRGESIRIGDAVITILELHGGGNNVRIGIEAPRSVAVTRPDAKVKHERKAV